MVTSDQPLRAPFPYFGGKRDVADLVWGRLGRAKQYLEPFCGSAAVLLAAPEPAPLEVVGDQNGFIANFWRAVVHQAETVARWADYPVSHIDLGGRHRWLLAQRARLGAELQDPDWPGDPKVAGWWLWGACAWIGSGWCVWETHREQAFDQKPRVSVPGDGIFAPSQVADPGAGGRVDDMSRRYGARWRDREEDRATEASENGKRPDVANHGRGVHSDGAGQISFVGNLGMGVQAAGQIPMVTRTGQGVQSEAHADKAANGQIPFVRSSQGIHTLAGSDDIDQALWTSAGRVAMGWLRRLAARLERVRVIHGDWTRCLHHYYGGDQTAVFLDPPYRDHEALYGAGEVGLAAEVATWCRDNQRLRIALCGHRGDYDLPGFDAVEWNRRRPGTFGGGYDTARMETIWFSPGCLPAQRSQLGLFG